MIVGPENAPAVVILHGMLGNSRNWMRVLKLMEGHFRCHALDLRNHGRSPHADTMDYASQAQDVKAYLEANRLREAALVGHSMGGKVAMTLAAKDPSHVSHLVVVDMAPKAYPSRWETEFATMRALPVESFKTRGEADAALEPTIRDWAFRKFLLTNLARKPEGGFEWSVNLPLLQRCLPSLFQNPLAESDTFEGPTLFLRGARSNFVLDEDEARIRRHFPQGRVETVADAGHSPHFDQPEAVSAALMRFLEA